jgi:hypothetical protein
MPFKAQFIRIDPLVLVNPRQNDKPRYLYVLANPVMLVDSDGRDPRGSQAFSSRRWQAMYPITGLGINVVVPGVPWGQPNVQTVITNQASNVLVHLPHLGQIPLGQQATGGGYGSAAAANGWGAVGGMAGILALGYYGCEKRCMCSHKFDLNEEPPFPCPWKEPAERPKNFRSTLMVNGKCLDVLTMESCDDLKCKAGVIWECNWTGEWNFIKYFSHGCPGGNY